MKAKRRDSAAAALACVGAAAMLGPLFLWLLDGAQGASADIERFDGRARGEVTLGGVVVLLGAASVGVAIVGLVGLGGWLLVHAARLGRGRGRNRGGGSDGGRGR